jgi:hypothetical protein
MAGNGIKGVLSESFCEKSAFETGFVIDRGWELMEYFTKM